MAFFNKKPIKKSYEELSRQYLSFLIDKHGFQYSYSWDTPFRRIRLSKNSDYLLFEDLPQFEESYLYVFNNGDKTNVDLDKIRDEIYRTEKSKNRDEQFWITISEKMQKEIDASDTVFGIKIR